MFPVFQQATSLVAYCYEIVSYSVNFGQYVPPPFTVTVNKPLGTLFVSLPSIYQTYSLQTTSGALAEAFKNPKTKLVMLDSFKSIITGSDGYYMFCDLVALSGQPSLLCPLTILMMQIVLPRMLLLFPILFKSATRST
jgi:hypothetical protein